MALVGTRRITEVIGWGFIVLVVGVVAFGAFRGLWWDPSHRPVVIVAGQHDAPWSIEVDGKLVCPALATPIDEAHLQTCPVTLATGAHTLVARGKDGAERFRTEATITRGTSEYIWVPEIPEGTCIRVRTVKYTDLPQLSLGFLGGGGTPPTEVAPGFSDLGEVDVWFGPAPPKVESNDENASRVTVRLEACEAKTHDRSGD